MWNYNTILCFTDINSIQMYYMVNCATPVIHVWCCMCITCIEHMYYTYIRYTCIVPVFLQDIHLYYTCIPTHILYLYFYRIYTCITQVFLHIYFMCMLYTCISCLKHVYYRCSQHILQVYELHVYLIHHRPQHMYYIYISHMLYILVHFLAYESLLNKMNTIVKLY